MIPIIVAYLSGLATFGVIFGIRWVWLSAWSKALTGLTVALDKRSQGLDTWSASLDRRAIVLEEVQDHLTQQAQELAKQANWRSN